ncbi:uncharacterized protein LOC135827840 isoform X2 [Sycon ciliatum]|uniref:uncharacterized protein LOC135827840 isoform X1 n=1 Tax=Sycon ciliatum TaxID=27933 RepID=UPI0031F6C524
MDDENASTAEISEALDVDDDSWLPSLKAELMATGEWKAVSEQIFAKVEGSLRGSGLAKFSEFDDSSKLYTLQTATGSLQRTPAFKQLSDKVSAVVDRLLSERATQSVLLHRGSLAESTANPVSDVMAECCKCAVHLLGRWPDLSRSFKLCANRALSQPLRRAYWHARWRDVAAETDFLRRCRSSPLTTVSMDDAEIARQVEILLASSAATREEHELWRHGDTGMSAVKRLVSAYHARCSQRSRHVVLTSATLHRAVAFVHAMTPAAAGDHHHHRPLSPSRRRRHVESHDADDVMDDVMAPMLGSFVRFEDALPPVFQTLQDRGVKSAADQVARDVDTLLKEQHPELHQHLRCVFGCAAAAAAENPQLASINGKGTNASASSSSQLSAASASTTGSRSSTHTGAPFYKYLRNTLHPHWQVLFSGSLPVDVVCFLWEQLWMFDSPVADESPYTYLAVATTALLILLSPYLMECQQVRKLEECLVAKPSSLTVEDFQMEIGKRFLEKLQQSSGLGMREQSESCLDFPGVSTSFPGTPDVLANPPPWIYWSKDERKRRTVEQRAAAHEHRLRMLSGARREVEEKRKHEEDRLLRGTGVRSYSDLRQENARLRELLDEYTRKNSSGQRSQYSLGLTPTITSPPPEIGNYRDSVTPSITSSVMSSLSGRRDNFTPESIPLPTPSDRSGRHTTRQPTQHPTRNTARHSTQHTTRNSTQHTTHTRDEPDAESRVSAVADGVATPLAEQQPTRTVSHSSPTALNPAQILVSEGLRALGRSIADFVAGDGTAAVRGEDSGSGGGSSTEPPSPHNQSVAELRQNYRQALLNVEMEIFGVNLTAEEWKELPPQNALQRKLRVKKETLRRRCVTGRAPTTGVLPPSW